MDPAPIAFRMQLKPGCAAEYKRRHDEIWPELADALSASGVYDYSIFLDAVSLSLFAVLRLRPDHRRDELPHLPVVRRWWAHMADLMVVQPDNRRVEWPLEAVFRFPGPRSSEPEDDRI